MSLDFALVPRCSSFSMVILWGPGDFLSFKVFRIYTYSSVTNGLFIYSVGSWSPWWFLISPCTCCSLLFGTLMFTIFCSLWIMTDDDLVSSSFMALVSFQLKCVALPSCAICSERSTSALIFLSKFPSHRWFAGQEHPLPQFYLPGFSFP